jgi:hypothetical protein
MVFIVAPRGSIRGGARDILLRVRDEGRFDQTVPYRLIGPEGHDGDRTGDGPESGEGEH